MNDNINSIQRNEMLISAVREMLAYRLEANSTYFEDLCRQVETLLPERITASIDWDTDGETPDLPQEVTIPAHIEDEGIADYLSDTYGWCVNSLTLK